MLRAYSPDSFRPLRRDLGAITGDGATASVMIGAGETYLSAFVLAMGMGEVFAGLIASVPMLAGALLQLASPFAVRQLGSNRRWVVLCATLQAASFVPLVVAGIVGHISHIEMFLVATIYWGAGFASGPAWNTWVGTLVPPRMRAKFFARRSRFAQGSILLGFIVGGLALHAGQKSGHVLAAFSLIFALAGFCRFVSSRLLASQSEPAPPNDDHQAAPPWTVISRLRSRGDGRLLTYLLCVQAAVFISGPYFTPFMLKHLHLSYFDYVVLIAISFLAKVLALPALGKLAHKSGARRLLWLGGIGIIPISAMWNASTELWYLMLIQVIGGVAWAAYELAMFLLFFETIHESERTSVLTTYNFGHAVATVAGSLIGAALLKAFGETRESYLTLFALSSWARAATLVLLARLPERTPRRKVTEPEIDDSLELDEVAV